MLLFFLLPAATLFYAFCSEPANAQNLSVIFVLAVRYNYESELSFDLILFKNQYFPMEILGKMVYLKNTNQNVFVEQKKFLAKRWIYVKNTNQNAVF